MPGQIARRHGLLRAPTLVTRDLFQIFVQKPRPGGPNISVRARLAHGRGHLHGAGEIFLKVFAHDGCLRVGVSHVQVALEHHQHAFDLRRLRCGWESAQEIRLAGERPACCQQALHEISSSHEVLIP